MDQINTTPPRALPNATTVLVLGILSIVMCFCYGIIGIILGIIALILAGKDKKLYQLDAATYTESSYKNLKAGRICAIIGLILSVIYIGYIVFVLYMIGFDALSNPELLIERLKNMQQ